jgi:hypothetical protein
VTVLLLRRAIIGVAVTFLRQYFFIQLEILLVTSLFCLCYITLVKPYQSQLSNFVEMANEGLIICTVYIMHCFSFFIPSVETRYGLGWVYLGVVAIVLVINVAAILIACAKLAVREGKKLYQSAKRLWNKTSCKRKRKYRQTRLNVV